MRDGSVVGWTDTNEIKNESTKEKERSWGTLSYKPGAPGDVEVLPGCGIAGEDCENPFCSAQTTTADNKILVFGGNEADPANGPDEFSGISAFRSYDHSNGEVRECVERRGKSWLLPG